MGYKIEIACVTHTGYVREKNEDSFYVDGLFPDQKHGNMSKPLQDIFFTDMLKTVAVFDGLGGENAGEAASYTAAQKLSELCQIEKIKKTDIMHMMRTMNKAVCSKAEQDGLGQIRTTATILFFQDQYAYVANVGDSPVYILRKGRLKFIAEKHTDGEILKPSLTQCLGIPEEELLIEPYIAGIEIQVGDVFLICSNGLTDMLREVQIRKILKKRWPAFRMAKQLLSKALENGGFDNITAICCKVVKS